MIELILALGIVAFLLLYLALSLQDDQFLLKLLLLFFVFGIIILIGKAYLDHSSGTLTDMNNTGRLFFKTVTWLFVVFITYIFLYANWWFWLGRIVQKSKTWGKLANRLKGVK